MIEPAPSNLPLPQLPEICDVAQLEPESRDLLREEHGPREFIATLVANERYADVTRFLAHVLPKREAIFWAWSTARRMLDGDTPAPGVKEAIEATGRWITEPTEQNRRPMLELAQNAELSTPAGCAALAVFLSGGSLAPPDLPPVEPEYHAAAKAITGCLVLAAVANEPEKADEKLAGFIVQGIDIGRRVGLWPGEPGRG